jgi:hypothetical protein
VEGVLRFLNRQQIVNSAANYLELEITGIGGAPKRLFRWNIKEPG